MAFSVLPYIIILIVMTLFVKVINTAISVVWTLLVSSYSLSLPGLLWGGGQFNFPDFTHPVAGSPMYFYYWFFAIATILFLVFLAVNAFRHLSFWGKFDEGTQYEGTSFFHQFKWYFLLIVMTFLTPILIWACYSVLMIGVYFFMNLIGENSLFLNISSEDWGDLKTKLASDLAMLSNLGYNEMLNALKDLQNQDVYNKLIAAGWTEFQATNFSLALDTVINALQDGDENLFAEIQAQAQVAAAALDQATWETGLDMYSLIPCQNAILDLINQTMFRFKVTTDGIVVGDHGVWGAWNVLFGFSADNKYSFESALIAIYGSVEDIPTVHGLDVVYQEWKNCSGIFAALGYGEDSSMSLANLKSIVYLRVTGYEAYNLDSGGIVDISYIGFANGQELNLKTCPLITFVNAAVTGSRGIDFSKIATRNVGAVIGGWMMILLGEQLWNVGGQMWVGVGLATLGTAILIGGFIILLKFGLPVFIQSIIYVFCAKSILMPLLGMTVFIWAALIEAMWYFFLLLPAIAASVADGGTRIYKEAWKHHIGKMASCLLTWAGLLLMFTALFQVTALSDMIWSGAGKLSGNWDFKTEFTFDLAAGLGDNEIIGLLAGLVGDINKVVKFPIYWQPLVGFVIVSIILNSTTKFIPKLGELAFPGVYADYGDYLQNPINGVAPGLAKSFQGSMGLIGNAKGLGNKLGKAGSAGLNRVWNSKAVQNSKAGKFLGLGQGAKGRIDDKLANWGLKDPRVTTGGVARVSDEAMRNHQQGVSAGGSAGSGGSGSSSSSGSGSTPLRQETVLQNQRKASENSIKYQQTFETGISGHSGKQVSETTQKAAGSKMYQEAVASGDKGRIKAAKKSLYSNLSKSEAKGIIQQGKQWDQGAVNKANQQHQVSHAKIQGQVSAARTKAYDKEMSKLRV